MFVREWVQCQNNLKPNYWFFTSFVLRLSTFFRGGLFNEIDNVFKGEKKKVACKTNLNGSLNLFSDRKHEGGIALELRRT